MKSTVYLIADMYGVQRMAKRQARPGRNELAVRLTVTIPDACFKSPIVGVSIDVPPDRLIQPEVSVTVEPGAPA